MFVLNRQSNIKKKKKSFSLKKKKSFLSTFCNPNTTLGFLRFSNHIDLIDTKYQLIATNYEKGNKKKKKEKARKLEIILSL